MFKKKFIHYSSFIPFKYTLFVGLFVAACVVLVYKKWYYELNDNTVFIKFLKLLVKFGSVFLFSAMGIAIISSIGAFLYFLLIRKTNKNKQIITVKLGEGQYASVGKAPIQIAIYGAFRPLFGSVKARLIFNDFTRSEELVLDKDVFGDKKWMRSGIKGEIKSWLPDSKEYRLSGVILFFEDFFSVFSLPFYEKKVQVLYITPPKQMVEDLNIVPTKAEEDAERIPLPKKIQGEYINYKSFESGDDIRRIVWKIYARNKELVVRTPEVTDPYASHIIVYVSFLNSLQSAFSDDFDAEMLNYYKMKIRYVFESLQASDVEVRLVFDQPASGSLDVPEENRTLYQISASNWKKDYLLGSFYSPNQLGVLMVSSLIKAEELAETLEFRNSDESVVVVVKASDVFVDKTPFTWERIFFSVKESRNAKLKRNWLLSGYRRKVLKNEKAIKEMLEQMNAEVRWV